jgi:hypothetical protein
MVSKSTGQYRFRGSPSTHGEVIHYRRGCRCGLCRKANTKRSQEYRRQNPKSYQTAWLKHRYKITPDQLIELLRAYNNQCAVCFQSEKYETRRLCIDHNHMTNQIRGILCNNCNRALGLLGDSIPNIKNLLSYMEKHSEKDNEQTNHRGLQK